MMIRHLHSSPSHQSFETGNSLYTNGTIVASSSSLQSALETPSNTSYSPYTITPTSPGAGSFHDSIIEDDRSSLFSPGPTFVDDYEDDMDDEKMMVHSLGFPL